MFGVGAAVAVAVGIAIYALAPEDKSDMFQIHDTIPGSGTGLNAALYQSLGVRMAPGHSVSWLPNGTVFEALDKDIASARSSVHMLLYIWEKGKASNRITATLVARAKAGVRCRILVDAFGSPSFLDDVAPSLVKAGCDVRVFRPLSGSNKLARNHRKIVVVDGNVAITGGFGLRDNWLGDGVNESQWRDANARFSGPAVAEAQQAFAENWQEAGGALLAPEDFAAASGQGTALATFVSSTNNAVVTRAERLTQLLMHASTKRLWIANAYFVPSRAILDLLKLKASQGVDVRLLAPGKKSDSKTSFGAQHSEYGDLLKNGVRIWEYQPSMMHAKTMLVDDHLVIVGSINLDPLSLNKLEEGALVVDDQDFARQLDHSFIEDCKHAVELNKP